DGALTDFRVLTELHERRPLQRAHAQVDRLVETGDAPEKRTAPDAGGVHARAEHIRAYRDLAVGLARGNRVVIPAAHEHAFDHRLTTVEERPRWRADGIDRHGEQEVAATLGRPHERHASRAPRTRLHESGPPHAP